uniref:Pheromone-binding protein Gp-9 n=2 Tax=Nylanderia TaxID=710235 RepID=F1CZR4_9HYME|nr:putative odorant binding protein precursor [Nylanderia nr. pubens LZ-2010]ADX36427.1 putative odorant binding protein [Nylanderia nr. pubens LZ-2010]AEG74452.1 putative odorant-binding protein precursor [Nylanderia nr. pubens LZ-2011]
MKFLALFVWLMAIVMIAYANTIADTALHGESLPAADLEQCYERANLVEADLITNAEIKDGSYKNPENAQKAKKNGCFVLCILEKRGLIVDSEIQKDKLYGKSAHAHLNQATQAKIYATVDRCIEQVKTKPDMCDKSLDLLTCLWKDF